MNRCPITYQPCGGGYSKQGLKLLSRRLTGLKDLPFSAQELRREAAARSGKMSIQGVQPKLSAQLNIKEQQFVFVDRGGHYILKPQTVDYLEVPENEDLTMRLASIAGIEVPLHGLLYGRDRQLNYFIRRFDRVGRKDKVHVEELALPINGKKNRLKRQDLVDYFGRNRLQLTSRVIEKVMLELKQARTGWEQLLALSFLSEQMKEKYLSVLKDRFLRLYE